MGALVGVLALALLLQACSAIDVQDGRSLLPAQLAQRKQLMEAYASHHNLRVLGRKTLEAVAVAKQAAPTVPGGLPLSPLDISTDVRWTAPPLRAIVFIVNMCDKGGGAAAAQKDVWKILRDGTANLKEYYDSCSYGHTTLDLESTTVVGPLTMPCTGVGSAAMGSQPWTVSSCRGSNPYGWFSWVETYAVKTLKIDLSQYNHRVMIMPKLHQTFQETGCDWAGISTTGPINPEPLKPANYKYSYTWLAGDTWENPWLWFHELGHGLWLHHANTPELEYGDIGSAMGGAKGYGLRCYNPPQVWQLGWGSAFVLLTRPDLTAGVTALRWIPAAHTEADHFIRIALAPNAVAAGGGGGDGDDLSGLPDDCAAQLWVSYRTTSSQYDQPWKEMGSGAALVHRWDGNTFSSQPKSVLMAALKVPNAKTPGDVQGNSYALDSCRLVITAQDMWDGYALIGVCVRTSDSDVEENCSDGLDDDCDGLIDMKDPDCQRPPGKQVARSPRPSPSPRPVSDDDDDETTYDAPGLIYEGLLHLIFGTGSKPSPSPSRSPAAKKSPSPLSGGGRGTGGGSGSGVKAALSKSVKPAGRRRQALRL